MATQQSRDVSTMYGPEDGAERPLNSADTLRARFGAYLPPPNLVNSTADLAPQETVYDAPMNSPTREEFEARIEAVESRMEARASRIESKIDQMLARVEAREAVQEERLRSLGDKMTSLAAEATTTRQSVSALKTTVITTVLATALGAIGLIYMLNTGLYGAFESGKNTATALSEAANKLAQTNEKLEELSAKVSSQQLNQAGKPVPSSAAGH